MMLQPTILVVPVYFLFTFYSVDGYQELKPKENSDLKKYCGLSIKPPPFKVNGVDAGTQQFPWAALVRTKIDVKVCDLNDKYLTTLKNKPIACSGTLISQRHVITAAHCFYNAIEKRNPQGKTVSTKIGDKVSNPLKRIQVFLGGVEREVMKRFEAKTDQIILGSENPADLAGGLDYAILELKTDVTEQEMKNKDIVPVCLTTPTPDVKTATLVGFGNAGGDPPPPRRLRFYAGLETGPVCPEDYNDPYGCLACNCFPQPHGIKISQHGDSGAGYYVYDDGKPPRAHLYAVQFSKHKEGTLMVAINSDRGQFINEAKDKLNINYVV